MPVKKKTRTKTKISAPRKKAARKKASSKKKVLPASASRTKKGASRSSRKKKTTTKNAVPKRKPTAAKVVREPQKKTSSKLHQADAIRPRTKANEAMHPVVADEDLFNRPELVERAYYSDDTALVFNMDVRAALRLLSESGVLVNCIVTSPPFYGQRDYEVDGQIGLEEHPAEFVNQLVETFELCKSILADNGSLWVNLGDTYWSGKGEHRSGESKQGARRFGLRPQDKKGDGLWCKPKQLLLIPHRFAIAMQDSGWLVRNDNVWVKPNPIPDQVRDRCSISHEYVFHFVKERWYYFDKNSVGRASPSGTVLPPLDTWEVPTVRGVNGHKARFSEELVRIPVLTTTPPRGVVLDPFGGSGTSLLYARKHGFRTIGIDIKEEFCEMMATQLSNAAVEETKEDLFEE